MQFISSCPSPLGQILLTADTLGLTGLWFEQQDHYGHLTFSGIKKELPVFSQTALWLSRYFSGMKPDFTPPLHLNGTAFQMEVWAILQQIPYGETITYSEIARIIAHRRGQKKMSAQAVGFAVGHNPISLIVPCHRVVGTNGKLTGYAGGLKRKAWLLDLEKGNSPIFSPHESY